MKRTTRGIIEVLLVGTGAGRIDDLRRLAAADNLRCKLHGVLDTGLAVAFLIQHSPYELAPRPDLILLDVDLGESANREFLQHLKRSEALQAIPVITLAPADEALRAYQLQANAQLPRPQTDEEWIRALRVLEDFWTRVATLPGRV